MTDRERMQQMAAEAKQKKQSDADKRAAQIADDERKTEGIADWGETLLPYKFETEHELVVQQAEAHNFGFSDLASEQLVCFWVRHEDFEKRGEIPLLAARCKGGAYELRKLKGKTESFNSFDELKAEIVPYLSKIDRDFMRIAIPRFCREYQWVKVS